MHIDRRLLGWGAFFILVGGIPLAVRGGVLDEAFVSRWPALWPVLLIGWGLGLLLRRTPIDWVGGAVGAIVFGIMGGGALATGFGGVPIMSGGCGGDASGTTFATQQGTFAGAGQLNVEFNCGSLLIGAVDAADWSVSGSAPAGRAPSVTTSGSTVSIESASGGSLFEDAGKSSWTVGVPRAPELGLGVTLNAGEGTADLAGATISSVSLTVNAGSFSMDLAGATRVGDVNATVNAGNATVSLPAGGRSANLSLNAGNLDVCVPAGAAVRVRWSGALGANDLDASGLVKVDDNTWTSAGFVDSQPHLELRVSANAGSFGMSIGGTCDA
jgi:hypothetical protein